jgi:hypothetical protein
MRRLAGCARSLSLIAMAALMPMWATVAAEGLSRSGSDGAVVGASARLMEAERATWVRRSPSEAESRQAVRTQSFGPITVLSENIYTQNWTIFESTYYVAEIRNDGSTVLTDISWYVKAYDSGGHLIYEGEQFGDELYRLGPGEREGMKASVPEQTAWCVIVAFAANETNVLPNRNFTIQVVDRHTDADGYEFISVDVANLNNTTASEVEVRATFYEGSGIVQLEWNMTGGADTCGDLPPGRVCRAWFMRAPGDPYYSRFELVANATSAPGALIVAPDAPGGFQATPGNRKATLSWHAPLSDGGGPVQDYVIQYRPLGDSTWTPFADGVSTSLAASVTGLTNGTSYQFRVAAQNIAGLGQWSDPAGATPAVPPGAPLVPTTQPGDSRVMVSWLAPSSDGGAAVTDYVIQSRQLGTSEWSTFPDGTSTSLAASVTGLTNGTSYQFRIAAQNAAGLGPWSDIVLEAPAIRPTVPRSVVGRPEDGEVVISWLPPVSNGGAAITDYVIQYRRKGTAAWSVFPDAVSTVSSTPVTGLTNGTSYQFRVAARNAMGTSRWSSVVLVGAGVPTAPRLVVAAPASTQVTLSWKAPTYTGSAPITDYRVQYRQVGTTGWTNFKDGVSTTLHAHVTGLVNGTTYQFRVTAMNSRGLGLWSLIVPGTPGT